MFREHCRRSHCFDSCLFQLVVCGLGSVQMFRLGVPLDLFAGMSDFVSDNSESILGEAIG